MGVQKMFNHLWHSQQWWRTMRKDLQQALDDCDACQKINVVQQGFHPQSDISAAEPFTRIAMDLGTALAPTPRGNHYLLIKGVSFARETIVNKQPCLQPCLPLCSQA
jgi:hypothetical protein